MTFIFKSFNFISVYVAFFMLLIPIWLCFCYENYSAIRGAQTVSHNFTDNFNSRTLFCFQRNHHKLKLSVILDALSIYLVVLTAYATESYTVGASFVVFVYNFLIVYSLWAKLKDEEGKDRLELLNVVNE